LWTGEFDALSTIVFVGYIAAPPMSGAFIGEEVKTESAANDAATSVTENVLFMGRSSFRFSDCKVWVDLLSAHQLLRG